MFFSLYNLYTILPELYLFLSINILLLYNVLYSTSTKHGYPVMTYSMGLLSIYICAVCVTISQNMHITNILGWENFLLCNFLCITSKNLLCLAFIVWILLTISYLQNEKINPGEYWILSLLALISAFLIIQSHDLFSMYLSIEFQSLVFYVLASFNRTSEFSTEAGLKYFILGAFSSAFLLLGCSLLYGITGLTNFADYTKLVMGFHDTNKQLNWNIGVGVFFVIVSILFKLSAAPFHIWSPDVYEGAPTSTTAFFSIFPKLAIVSLLLNFILFGFFDYFYLWQSEALLCAYISVSIGTLSAFTQTKWKRFIAYSSITHIGFILIGLGSGNIDGIFASIFYVISYMITTFTVFLFVISCRYFKYPVDSQTRHLNDLMGLSKHFPVMGFILTLALFSMAGIPPLLGFFSKAFVLLSSIQEKFYGVSTFAVVMSCVACFYYIRLIQKIYFKVPKYWVVICPINFSASFLMCICLFVTCFIFLDLELLSLIITRMILVFTL